MTAPIDLFRSLSKNLDETIQKVDHDLPLAEDIHTAIREIGTYAADMLRLPAALAKLEAQSVSIEASVPAREKAVRRAKNAVDMLAAKLKKLGERIDRNRNALTEDDLKPAVRSADPLLDAFVPTRLDIIEGIRKEMIAAEDELAAARTSLKRAEAFRKGVDTRKANLATEIDAAKKALADHGNRLEEIVRILRKTVAHLKNRQEKRDRKRQIRTVTTVVAPENVAIGALKAPSDDDVRKLAEAHGLSLDGPEDLEVARQLLA